MNNSSINNGNLLDAKGLPMILNIGIGDICMTYCMEIFLSKLFASQGTKVYQEFTDYTHQILCNLESASLINSMLLSKNNQNLVPINEYELFIKSAYFNNVHSLIDSFDTISSYSPDFVLLNGNGRFNSQYDLQTIFKYRLGCNVYMVNSKYVDINKDENNCRLVLCPSLSGINYFGSKEFEAETQRKINTYLCFPNSVYII